MAHNPCNPSSGRRRKPAGKKRPFSKKSSTRKGKK